MEITLVHPDDRESKVTVNNPIQIAAYKSQGFVELDDFAAGEARAVAEKNETEELRAQVAELEEKLASEAEGKLSEQGDSEEVAELKKQLKMERAARTRLENKLNQDVEDKDVTKTDTLPVDPKQESEKE